jgi:hypothetical protein
VLCEPIERRPQSIARCSAAVLTRDLRHLLDQDPELELFNAYRQLTRVTGDELRALQRHSAAVNLQSILMTLQVDAHKVFFTGNMQFNKPEVGSAELKASMKELPQLIEAQAP